MPFLLTTIAGLSTMLGTILIFKKNKNNSILISSLSFASAVMLTVSFTDLIPESINLLSSTFKTFPMVIIILLFINIGIILSTFINKYTPNTHNNNNLYRVGVISMLAIMLHNIPEGIATFMASNTNISLGITLTMAIALHNIPEGISISIPIYYATKSKTKAILYTFISGISELLGAIITFLFLKPFISNTLMGCLFAIIAGIMTHISITELLPTSFNFNNKKLSITYFIIGVIFMTICHLLLN